VGLLQLHRVHYFLSAGTDDLTVGMEDEDEEWLVGRDGGVQEFHDPLQDEDGVIGAAAAAGA